MKDINLNVNPRSRKWQPTPVFLPGKFHGQRRLMDYSPWGHKKSDMTKQLSSCANIENMDFPGLSGLKKKKIHLPMQERWAEPLGWEDPPAEGNDNPLLYSCLGNPMDRGGWWATVHGVT